MTKKIYLSLESILTGMSVHCLFYKTRTHFASQLQEEFLKYHKVASYRRWTMAEWYREIGYRENALFDEVSMLFNSVIQPRESEAHENFGDAKDVLLDLLTSALLELREEGLFSSVNENLILYLEQSDSYIDDLMRERIRKLLGEKYYQEFLYDYRDEDGFAKLISFNSHS